MRYFLILLILCTTSTAFARVKVKDPMVITDAATFTSSAKPDMMESGMTVQYKSPDYAAVSSAMEKISGVVKANKNICSYAGYRISPEYTYKDGQQLNDGYMGYLDFSCSFTAVPSYEKVVNGVFEISSKDPAYLLTSKSVQWTVSGKVLDTLRSQMKLDAIRSVLRTAREYSRASGLYCTAKDIKLEYADSVPVMREYAAVRSAKAQAIAVSEPDRQDQSVSLTVKYNYVCR